jgi:hypothetical protein
MELTASELVHQVVTVTDGFEHRAECSCGWESEWYLDDVEAVEAGVEHPEIAVGHADCLDVFVSGLLDVQDDLAALVVWLAENWSSDLPMPEVSRCTSSGSDVLDVWVQCADACTLARIADRMGAPVERDSRYDSASGTFYCARRWFGRVLVEAWRYER